MLDAAVMAFAHDGLAGTPTRAIARAAGVTISTVYHHFSSKRALYVAAYTHAIDLSSAECAAAIAGAASLTDELTAILETSLDLMRRRPEITMLALRAQTDLDDPELRPEKLPPSAARLIHDLTGRAVARGELGDADVHAFSHLFGVALWGLSVVGLSDDVARERTVRALERLVLAGVHPPSAGASTIRRVSPARQLHGA